MSSNLQISKVCEFCQKDFVAKQYRTKYCSHKCSSRAVKKRARDLKNDSFKEAKKIESLGVDLLSLNDKKYMNIKEAGIYIGVSRASMYRYIKKGLIIHIKIGGRVLFNREILDDFLEKMEQK